MPTVFNRIYAYSKNNNVAMFSMFQRIQIGRVVIGAYFSAGGTEKKLGKAQASKYDGNGKFRVMYYPKEYTALIDDIIDNYYKNVIVKSKETGKPIQAFERLGRCFSNQNGEQKV